MSLERPVWHPGKLELFVLANLSFLANPHFICKSAESLEKHCFLVRENYFSTSVLAFCWLTEQPVILYTRSSLTKRDMNEFLSRPEAVNLA